MIITITDIRNRINGLSSISNTNSSKAFIESAKFTTRVADAKRLIENAVSSNCEVPFHTYLELYDIIVENGNESDIKKIGSIISEKAVCKTRDSKHTLTLIRMRLGRTGVNIKDKASPFTDKFKQMGKRNKASKSKLEAAISSYEDMEKKAIICINCDRLLENYNRISKRFNLELLFNENTRINGVRDTVIELCNYIDTYQMPNNVKFNTVIETALYGFESNFIEYKKSDILESAMDYFLFKQDGLADCKNILESTLFFDKNDDMRNIDVITEEEPEEKENSIQDDIMEYCSKSNFQKGYVKESTDFDDIFKKFKEEELAKDGKPENKLKLLITKLYSRSVTSITEETPNLLAWIRSFFILSTGTIPVIGPVIMAVGFIVDRYMQLKVDEKEVVKMIKCFDNEIKTSKTKLDTLPEGENKRNLNSYIDALKKGRDKLDMYHNDIITDEEQEKKYEEMEPSSDFDDMFGDDDFNFFDDDDELFEAASIEGLLKSINEFMSYTKEHPIGYIDMYNICKIVDEDTLISISSLSNNYPDIFIKEALYDGIKSNIYNIKKNSIVFESTISRVIKISSLENAKSLLETNSANNTNSNVSIRKAKFNLDNLMESYKAIDMIIHSTNNTAQFLEASFANTLKMASMKLKDAITKLSDKDREISRSIDSSLSNFSKSVEKALTNDNRESIIKGSILPSASKIIKLAIANAGLFILGQPALAVIGTLSYIASSSRFKAKERQMVIDEIEIELKICQKYIDIAEQKNDMKALKNLLTIQRNLERQLQRIKYKMKVDFGQTVYDIDKED